MPGLPNDTSVVHVYYPCDVFVGLQGVAQTSLKYLGHTRNGAEIEIREFTGDVPTDENAGEEGPPTDIQFFGAMATIRLDLTKYDDTAISAIRQHLADSFAVPRAGWLPSEVGRLKISGTEMYRLLIRGTFNADHTKLTPEQAAIWNFPRCMFAEPKPVNVGSKFSSALLVATAYHMPLTVGSVLTNVLFNQDDQ
jgi:hypothetical protein